MRRIRDRFWPSCFEPYAGSDPRPQRTNRRRRHECHRSLPFIVPRAGPLAHAGSGLVALTDDGVMAAQDHHRGATPGRVVLSAIGIDSVDVVDHTTPTAPVGLCPDGWKAIALRTRLPASC